MKKKRVTALMVGMLITLLCTGIFNPAPALCKVITLKAVHFLPSFMDISKDFIELTKRINKQTEGELVIKVLGGPDVMPPPEQAEALRRGVIDCLMCPTEYYKHLLPEATVFHLGMLTAAEERESGDRHEDFWRRAIGRAT